MVLQLSLGLINYDKDKEMMQLGLANLLNGFTGGLPVFHQLGITIQVDFVKWDRLCPSFFLKFQLAKSYILQGTKTGATNQICGFAAGLFCLLVYLTDAAQVIAQVIIFSNLQGLLRVSWIGTFF